MTWLVRASIDMYPVNDPEAPCPVVEEGEGKDDVQVLGVKRMRRRVAAGVVGMLEATLVPRRRRRSWTRRWQTTLGVAATMPLPQPRLL